MKKPELLLPAGNMEKAKTAFLFGADAIYLGGKEFSLRAFAGNLEIDEIRQVTYEAHQQGKKVYVTVNILAHNRDFKNLIPYLEELQAFQVDGLIVSDPGIMRISHQYAPDIPITVSTQTNVTNYESAAVFKDLGASRIVLARELSLEEIREIKAKVDIELEIFIHGAMCVSYSGRCLLSHFMTGRSANQGACAHPCRYKYVLQEEKRPGQFYPIFEDERGTYILNSQDLCLLEYIPALITAGIDSFKIEGRMKSPLYVATVAGIYRQAIDCRVNQGESEWNENLPQWRKELERLATRPLTKGFIEGSNENMQDVSNEGIPGHIEFCGIVLDYDAENQQLIIEQRANFGPGEILELLIPDGRIIPFNISEIFDDKGEILDRARHPKQRVAIPWSYSVARGSILRRRGKDD